MLSIAEKIELVVNSASLEEIRNKGILPEPDTENDYWFVSYSHKDYKNVLVNIIELQNRGIRLWYDRGLDTGRDWRENVRSKIYSFRCRGIIAFVSENFMNSSACAEEIKHIKKSRKPCLALQIKSDAKPFEKRCTYKSIVCDYDEKEKLLFEMPRQELYNYKFYSYNDKKNAKRSYAILSGVNDLAIQKADIPAFITRKGEKIAVRKIGERAFFNCTELTEVNIPDGWSDIENEAFANCFSLKKVTLGKPLERKSQDGQAIFAQQFRRFFDIPDGSVDYDELKKHLFVIMLSIFAFKILSKHNLGKEIKYVGNISGAFKNCITLKEIKLDFPLDKDILITFEDAFVNCVALGVVDFAVSRYQRNCFVGCSALENAIFNKRQKCFKDMFALLPALRRVEFSQDNRTDKIDENAFNGCIALEEVIMPKNLLEIESGAFAECESLKEIVLPPSLKKIGERAFEMSALDSVELPKKVRYVAKDAFADIKNLSTATLNCSKLSFCEKERKNMPLVDEWFDAQTIYVGRGVKNKLSEKFVKVQSDKKGYKKYVRRSTNGINT